jgi:hypothetical protein
MARFCVCRKQAFVAVASFLLLAGCNGKGTVSGKVTLNGQPLPGGIVFVTTEAPEAEAFVAAPSGRILADGSYTVLNVPRGKARVSVVTAPAFGSAMHPTAVKEPWGPYVPIPEKYKDATKSPFTLEVKRGAQTFDIAMTGEVPPAEPKP